MKDRIREHPPLEDLNPDDSLVTELRQNGFPKLKKIVYSNLRVDHQSEEDAKRAMELIKKIRPRPDVILMEVADWTPQDRDKYQRYIESPTQHLSAESKGNFKASFVFLLHRWVFSRRRENVPLIVFSDLGWDWPNLEEHLKPYFDFENWWTLLIDDTTHGEHPISFAEAQQRLHGIIQKVVEVNKAREAHIANSFASSLAAHPDRARLQNKKSISIAAPYGALHGPLSRLFQNKGAEARTMVHRHYEGTFTPEAQLFRRVQFNEPIRAPDLEDAVIGGRIYWVVTGIPDTIALTAHEKISYTWKILQKLRKENRNFEELYLLVRDNPDGFIQEITNQYKELSSTSPRTPSAK